MSSVKVTFDLDLLMQEINHSIYLECEDLFLTEKKFEFIWIKFERNSSIDFKTECGLFCCVFKSVLNASQEKIDEKPISSWFTFLSILYEP